VPAEWSAFLAPLRVLNNLRRRAALFRGDLGESLDLAC
jgi:hypothetical protein